MHGVWRKKTSENQNMIAKQHKTQDGKILISVCDSDLLGKRFEEKDLQIDLSSGFYQGEEKSEKEILDILRKCYIAMFVGEESINFAIKNNLLSEERAAKIKNIPFAQVLFLDE